MKKVFLIAFCVISVITLKAQSKTYKNFKVDVGLGYAIPTDGNSNSVGGITFTLEPHYRLTDAIALGLRLESAGLGFKQPGTNDVTVAVVSSYCATGEYYFMGGGFRPFAGAGLGLFTQQSVTIGSGSSAVISPSESKFGFFPRVGFETGHFRISSEYNSIDKGGYIAFKIGFFFGGGKK